MINKKKIKLIIAGGLVTSITLVGCTSKPPSAEEVVTNTNQETQNNNMNGNESPEETPDPPTHTLTKTETGAIHNIEAAETMSSSDLQDLKDIVKLISEEDSLNQPPDPVALYGDKPGLAVLQENRDKYKVIYLETEKGAGLEFVSEDPLIIQSLHQWVDSGELPSFGSGDLGVYGPSY